MTTQEKAAAAIQSFIESGRLYASFEKCGISSTLFYQTLKNVPSLADWYSRARELRADAMADEMLTISDSEEIDPNDKKVRIETRKWIASKWHARTYGDRLDVNVTERVDVSLAITEAKRRLLRPVSDLAQIEDAQYVELPALSNVRASDETSVAPAPAVENPFDD